MDEHRPIDKPGMRRMLFCLRIVRDASLRMSRLPSPKRASLVCLSIVNDRRHGADVVSVAATLDFNTRRPVRRIDTE